MTQRRSAMRGRSRPTGPRRKLVWASEIATFTAGVIATNFVSLLADFRVRLGANNVPGATITRIRGTVTARGTVGTSMDIRMGIIVVPEGLGTSTIPTPFVDLDDWMWLNARNIVQSAREVATDTFVGIDQVGHNVFDVDAKAQRKMEEVDQDLVFVGSAGAATAITYNLHLMTLLRLP